MKTSILYAILGGALALLLVTSCGDKTAPPPFLPGAGESAAFDFNLTSLARSGGANQPGSQTQSGPGLAAGKVEVSGQLLVVRHTGDGTEEKTYNWALIVDQGAFQINTEVKLNLEGGEYDFYFLMEGNGNQYAGVLQNQLILKGVNRIGFTLNPVIGAPDLKVDQLATLVRFQFQYDAGEITGYNEPFFSIIVDNGSENLFAINPQTGLPFVYVYLPPGTYRFEIRFYDGSLLKMVSINEAVEIGPSGTVQVSVVPLVTETTYTYDPVGTTGNSSTSFYFSVPGVLVQEAGGLNNLATQVSIVGPGTPLVEKTLTLEQSNANYVGGFTLPSFQPGEITWSLQFRNLNLGGVIFAYCAQTVTVEAGDTVISKTFICEPEMVSTRVSGSEAVAGLVVSVSDGNSVPGAVVSLSGKTVGITGGGDAGTTPGYLEIFHAGGTYPVQAVHKSLDSQGQVVTRSAGDNVALVPGQNQQVNLMLDALQTEPPQQQPPEDPGNTTDVKTITASREVRPRKWNDAEITLPGEALVRVPTAESLKVLAGNDQRYLFMLDFGKVKCWYLGGKWDSALDGSWEEVFERSFKSPACNHPDQVQNGLVEVKDTIRARVVMSDPHHDVTEIQASLEIVEYRSGE